MTNVTLKVNERALVRHLKLGFTSQTTVLGELIQNARRAKARVVVFDYDEAAGRLTVTDDGCGIDGCRRGVRPASSENSHKWI